MIVVDASVVARSSLQEHGSEQATQLLTGTRYLVAPDLSRVEEGFAAAVEDMG
ncbi:hypothetical protein [Gloeobacter morelensis]|uniref:Uncharacterized protein n=1 Tax=Gloeobacter morelensis MG652769 TaxID=2781736 RepID=A0ABY3PKR7_9CYAN|nr:hypothetical protein [Gloeobacter morelensis]UFP94262.1 hypothetical protein ISF26_21320 [Gloeobacter morelensis MG652769]